MMWIDAKGLDFRALSARLQGAQEDCTITGCCGQRFIAAGMSQGCVTIEGVPGNALGAYLNGACITVHANAQDAVGDTMNAGKIVIHGDIGDAAGYAMRGGKIFVQGSAGYRAGIHMKAYGDTVPAMVIGGSAGSFLGEYQAGGVIVVLGLNGPQRPIVGNYPCTGMHGGKLFLRGCAEGVRFPDQVTATAATAQDLLEIEPLVAEYCALFGLKVQDVLGVPFTVVTPDSKNPYRRMYAAN